MKSKKTLLLSLALFIGILTLYLLTLPNVHTGYADSDELITVANVWGVAHPPAYPLYTMLAGLFGRLPLPLTFAGRVNFLNAVLGSLTVVFVFLTGYQLLYKLTKQTYIVLTISCLGAASLAIFFSFWFYSLFAEVFGLHLFFVAAILWLCTLWPQQPRVLYAMALLVGLALGHQQTFVLLLPVFAVWILSKNWKVILNGKLLLIACALCIIGFVIPYGYLPVAAHHNPVINWENPQSFNGVVRSITRQVYRIGPAGKQTAYFGGSLSKHNFALGLLQYARFLTDNVTIPLLLIALLGLIFLLYARLWRVLIFIVLGISGGGLFFAVYAANLMSAGDSGYLITAGIHERFFLPSLLFWSLLIMYGVWGSYMLLSRLSTKLSWLVIGISALLLVQTGATHYHELRHNNFAAAHQFGTRLLDSLDKNAILICFAEHSCFTPIYLQTVEHLRPDVLILPSTFDYFSIDQFKRDHPELIKTTTQTKNTRQTILLMRDLIRWNIDKRPLYVSGINTAVQSMSFYGLYQDPFFLIPQGCVVRISRTFQVGKPSKQCTELDNELMHGYAALQAPITDMFPGYMAYQHLFNGQLYKEQHCYTQASHEFNQALVYNPYFAYALLAAGQLKAAHPADDCHAHGYVLSDEQLKERIEKAQAQRDYTGAIYYALQYTMIHPEDIDGRLQLASLYEKTRYFSDNIVTEYQDILQLDPHNQVALQKLHQLKK